MSSPFQFSRAGALACLTVAGCAGTPSRPAPAPSTVAAPAPATRGRIVVLATIDSPALVGANDHEQYIVAGGVRVVATAREVRFAQEWTSGTIAAAAPVTDGWVFVTDDGTFARSEAFDGPMRALGTVPAVVTEGVSSDTGAQEERDAVLSTAAGGAGRAAGVDAAGQLWLSDGNASPSRVSSLHAAVEMAAFSDADHGLALMRDRSIVATDDGGARWRTVLATAGPMLELSARDRGFVLANSDDTRSVSLGLDGAVLADPSPVGPARAHHVDRDTARRVLATWIHDYPDDARTLCPECSRFYFASARGNTPWGAGVVDFERREFHPLDEPRWAGCVRGEEWGGRLVVTCLHSDERQRLATDYFVTDDGTHFEPLEYPRTDRNTVTFSDDGAHAVLFHACDGHANPHGAKVVCVRSRGATADWHDVTLPGDLQEVSDLHGDAFIALGPPDVSDDAPGDAPSESGDPCGKKQSEDEGAEELPERTVTIGMMVHVDTASVTPVRLRVPAGVPTPELHVSGWAADGTPVFSSAREAPTADYDPDTGAPLTVEYDQGFALAVGDGANGPLALRSLPSRATNVAFVDRTHGIAAGMNLDELWQTADGGETWDAMGVPVAAGEPSMVSLDRRSPRQPSMQCRGTACNIGDRVRLVGPPPFEQPGAAPVVAADARDVDSRPGDFGADGWSAPSIRCRDVGPRARRAPALAVADTPRGAISRAWTTADGDAALALWPGENGEWNVRARWRTAAPARDVASPVGRVRLGDGDWSHALAHPEMIELLSIQPVGALFAVCDPAVGCRVLAATARDIVRIEPPALVDLDRVHVNGAVFGDDGSLALRLSTGAVWVSADRATTIARTMPLRASGGVVMFAVQGNEPGLVASDPADWASLVFQPLRPDAGVGGPMSAPIGRMVFEEIPFCSAPAPATAVRAYSTTAGPTEDDSDVEGVLEFTGQRPCIRALRSPYGGPAGAQMVLAAGAADGTLTGYAVRNGVRRTVECHRPPPPGVTPAGRGHRGARRRSH